MTIFYLLNKYNKNNDNTNKYNRYQPNYNDTLNNEKSDNVTLNPDEVKINKQVWLSINLDLHTFRNGDLIPQAKTDEEWQKAGENHEPAWCYYENDTSNGEKYGKLYNWYAVNDPRGLAPSGYHVPSELEWRKLSGFLGGKIVAGNSMKSISDWGDISAGTNESGFNALPGGRRADLGSFNYKGMFGCWWASTENDTSYAFSYLLTQTDGNVYGFGTNKNFGFSVRCIRDY